MSGSTSAYEVRCGRCNVSFPVEKKVCVHCGGRTSKPASLSAGDSMSSLGAGWEDGIQTDPASLPPLPPVRSQPGSTPIEPIDESPFSMGQSGLGEERENDRELDLEDEPSSIGRSLFRSLGGIVWILLLIGFSLARNCGE